MNDVIENFNFDRINKTVSICKYKTKLLFQCGKIFVGNRN